MPFLLSLFLSVAFARVHHPVHKAPRPKPYPSKVHMTKVATCAAKDAAKKVYVFKQWHLGPKIVTKGFREKYPQEKNQTAIYKALDEGVKRKELQLIVSEGCEGEIDSSFKPEFNGWSYAALKAQSYQRAYDRILTLVPLKIEAKYGDRVHTICGDDNALILEGNLRLSNLRGWTGYLSHLMESQNDPAQFKLYADSATDLLKIPKDTSRDQLIAKIKEQVKVELAAYQDSLSKRNDAFVKALSTHDFQNAAVVIGGLHAEDLKNKLEKAGLGCEILQPPGYETKDEKLVEDFSRALK